MLKQYVFMNWFSFRVYKYFWAVNIKMVLKRVYGKFQFCHYIIDIGFEAAIIKYQFASSVGKLKGLIVEYSGSADVKDTQCISLKNVSFFTLSMTTSKRSYWKRVWDVSGLIWVHLYVQVLKMFITELKNPLGFFTHNCLTWTVYI